MNFCKKKFFEICKNQLIFADMKKCNIFMFLCHNFRIFFGFGPVALVKCTLPYDEKSLLLREVKCTLSYENKFLLVREGEPSILVFRIRIGAHLSSKLDPDQVKLTIFGGHLDPDPHSNENPDPGDFGMRS
jgi:hypothetical protein